VNFIPQLKFPLLSLRTSDIAKKRYKGFNNPSDIEPFILTSKNNCCKMNNHNGNKEFGTISSNLIHMKKEEIDLKNQPFAFQT
jgi:hypothetical protein